MKYGQFIEAVGTFASELSFLGRAVADDETRYFMTFIHIEPSEVSAATEEGTPLFRGVATDGRRLHIVDPLSASAAVIYGLECGFWRSLKNGNHPWIAKLTEDPGTFPNYKKVMPVGEVKHRFKFDQFRLTGKQSFGPKNALAIAKFIREFPEPTAIDLRFLADLGDFESWEGEWRGPRTAVQFNSKNKTAIVMPLMWE